MREMLEPIFGPNGAVVASFAITLIVVLALVGIVVWLVRRYAAGGLGTTARGRLPRLAIIDAISIDARRRLVLVRRDNVEHLLLIGGPGDLLVEPGILRARAPSQRLPAAAPPAVRRPAAPPVTAETSAPAESTLREPGAPAVRPVEPLGADQPIPFPPRRNERPVARRELPRHVAGLVPARDGEARFAPFAMPADASPAEPQPPLEAAPVGEQPPEDAIEAPLIKAVLPDEDEAADPTVSPAAAAEAQDQSPTEETNVAESAPLAPGEPTADDGDTRATSAKVSDLEQEMARLLDELATRRSS